MGLDQQPIGGHDAPFQVPPIHPRCRSTLLPLLRDWSELGAAPSRARPDRTVDEVLRQRLRAKGWKADKIDQAMADACASMDGPVGATLSVEKWMERHPDRAETMLGRSGSSRGAPAWRSCATR